MRDEQVMPRALYLRRREFLALAAGGVVTAGLPWPSPARCALRMSRRLPS
jgi:hypothetical protein